MPTLAERKTRSLYKEGISWQGRTERKGLAELLANEKAIDPLLEFLESTEVGGREGAKEREIGRERGNDQAGEELLGKEHKMSRIKCGKTAQK